MGENVQSAINKLTAAMSRLDENQTTFEKEGDYKEMSEAFKAAYDVLKGLKPPNTGVTPALEMMRRRVADLEHEVRNGRRNLGDLATLLDNRSEADDDPNDNDPGLIVRRDEALAAVRALSSLFTSYPNAMMYREQAAANPFLVRQLVRRMNVQRAWLDCDVAHAAAAALGAMAIDCSAAKEQFFDQDGLMWLIDMIDDNDGASTNITAATFLVSRLCKDSPTTREKIGQRKDIFASLVTAFSNPDNDDNERESIANALYSLADSNEANQKAIREAGATAPLADALAQEVLEAEPDNNFALALRSFAVASPAAAMEEDE